MKKITLISAVIFGSLFLIANLGITFSAEPGYEITEYYNTLAVTVDGAWTGADEWHDVPILTAGTNAKWEYKMDSSSGTYLMSWLLEFADGTNDAGDIWQICIDGSNNGGSAPQTDDYKIEIEGHTTLKVYVGTGSGWTETTTSAISWADSMTTSPLDPSEHYILEIQVDKAALASWGANTPPHGIRVAMYDASNTAAGWQAWPPTSADDPSRWGLIATFSGDPFPEVLTFGAILMASFVALIGSSVLRKRLSKVVVC